MGELAQESTIRAEETSPIEPIDYGSPDRCALWMCNPRRRSPLATSWRRQPATYDAVTCQL